MHSSHEAHSAAHAPVSWSSPCCPPPIVSRPEHATLPPPRVGFSPFHMIQLSFSPPIIPSLVSQSNPSLVSRRSLPRPFLPDAGGVHRADHSHAIILPFSWRPPHPLDYVVLVSPALLRVSFRALPRHLDKRHV